MSSGAVVTVIALVTAAWPGIGDASFTETFLFFDNNGGQGRIRDPRGKGVCSKKGGSWSMEYGVINDFHLGLCTPAAMQMFA